VASPDRLAPDAVPDAGPELRLDHGRSDRTGIAEAVYAPGKTPEQCVGAVGGLLAGGTAPVLLTRADPAQAAAVDAVHRGATITPTGADADGTALSTLSWRPMPDRGRRVLVLTAGTGDLPVAREVVAVLAAYGHGAELIADVGVAGLHRVLAHEDDLARADAVVVVAGMEGALASVVAGLTPAPIVAVPTSTGYGAGLEGVTALLGMLASCSPGISVVGIDNGFGAACAVIRQLRAPARTVR
jgi:NCAIR mutase (PurE)-related protein